MNKSFNDISYLYDNHPKLYNAIANDRDFSCEVDDIIEVAGFQPQAILETFAGQANHAKQFKTKGALAFAIDNSNAMMKEAKSLDKYFVGWLPDILTDLESYKFDLILAMRFGIGHLDEKNLRKFIFHSKKLLTPSGMLILEIHSKIKPGQQFDDLEIEERTTYCKTYGKIKCRWPSENILWEGTKARMSVKITHDKPEPNEFNLVAPEYIHKQNKILSILSELKMSAKLVNFSSYSKLVLARAIEKSPM